MEEQVTTNEILEAINDFSSHVTEEFGRVHKEIREIKSVMATKEDLAATELKLIDAMDRKDERIRGDFTTLLRRQSLKPLNP